MRPNSRMKLNIGDLTNIRMEGRGEERISKQHKSQEMMEMNDEKKQI